MFQGDWEMPHQQEKWAVRGKLRIAHFCILHTNARLAKAVLFHQKVPFRENVLICSDRWRQIS